MRTTITHVDKWEVWIWREDTDGWPDEARLDRAGLAGVTGSQGARILPQRMRVEITRSGQIRHIGDVTVSIGGPRLKADGSPGKLSASNIYYHPRQVPRWALEVINETLDKEGIPVL